MSLYKDYTVLVQGLPWDIHENAIWNSSQVESIEALEPLLLDIYSMRKKGSFNRSSNSKSAGNHPVRNLQDRPKCKTCGKNNHKSEDCFYQKRNPKASLKQSKFKKEINSTFKKCLESSDSETYNGCVDVLFNGKRI